MATSAQITVRINERVLHHAQRMERENAELRDENARLRRLLAAKCDAFIELQVAYRDACRRAS